MTAHDRFDLAPELAPVRSRIAGDRRRAAEPAR
jgi:hypothetical protein